MCFASTLRPLYTLPHSEEVCLRFKFGRHFETHLARPPPFYSLRRMRTTTSDEHSIARILSLVDNASQGAALRCVVLHGIVMNYCERITASRKQCNARISTQCKDRLESYPCVATFHCVRPIREQKNHEMCGIKFHFARATHDQ